MNYNALALHEIETIIKNTDYTIGDVFREMTLKKNTGMDVTQRSDYSKLDSEGWYKILEGIRTNLTDKDPPMDDKEWEKFKDKNFK